MAKGNNHKHNHYCCLVCGPHQKIVTNRVLSHLHYCAIFTGYKQIINVAASCITESGGPGAEDPWS